MQPWTEALLKHLSSGSVHAGLINQKSMEFHLFHFSPSVSFTGSTSYLNTIYQYIGVEINYFLCIIYMST